MDIVLLNKENEATWNEFCLQSADAWFWHTKYWMDYVINYRPEFQPEQLSFFIKENNELLAICPLILEKNNDIKKFSFSDFGVPVPAFSDKLPVKIQKKVQNYIFEHIDAMALELGVKKATFRFSPLAKVYVQPKNHPANYLLKYGYLDASFNTQILDIFADPGTLKTAVRKGHKYDINRSGKIMESRIFDSKSITKEDFDLYCQLHHKDAGRVTRPQITFDLMYEWIKQGKAVLVGAKLKENCQYVGFSYHIVYKNGAYYASSASDPVCEDMPIAHFILWESISWLRNNQVRFFEIGWQFYGGELHYQASDKECQIAKFKRGFGGEKVPQLIAEKYFDTELFMLEYLKKIGYYKKYLEAKKTEKK